jgi:putative two-component system response regulator
MTESTADILVVDDTPANLRLMSEMLARRGFRSRCVADGRLALEAVAATPPDLILLDINMPGMDGYEVCRRLKADDRFKEIPVVFLSALAETEDKLRAFAVGGVDYIGKPFQIEEVNARITTHLKLRQLQRQLEEHNRQLAEIVRAQVKKISESHVATIVALAKLAESRDEDTGAHLFRVRGYCRVLATHLAQDGVHRQVIDEPFIDDLFFSSALHDIGKVSIPDAILLKRGSLTPAEWAVMQTHPVLGASTLDAVLAQYPDNEMIRMGREIARAHHERWDGTGYPQGIAGEEIPLAARIFTLADVYDALRSVRPYKRGFAHEETARIILEGDGRTMPAHWDPVVLAAFRATERELDEIWTRFEASAEAGGRASA